MLSTPRFLSPDPHRGADRWVLRSAGLHLSIAQTQGSGADRLILASGDLSDGSG
jgi:hypothetical protein